MIVLQRGLPLCAGASAAMAAGVTLEEVGHEIGFPLGGKGYALKDIARFLAKRGYLLGVHLNAPIEYYGPFSLDEKPLLTPTAETLLAELVRYYGSASQSQVLELAIETLAMMHGLKPRVPMEGIPDTLPDTLPTEGKLATDQKQRGWTVTIPFNLPALVVCTYAEGTDKDGAGHTVFWNGSAVHDPNRTTPQKLDSYHVLQWFPIYRFIG